jgi:hypothetical protein
MRGHNKSIPESMNIRATEATYCVKYLMQKMIKSKLET